MKQIKSLNDLTVLTSKFDEEVIFRSQDKHFLKDNKTSIASSFSRRGCQPENMQRWIHYCSETIYALRGPNNNEILTVEETEALLQHYGWRSFYIDATNDPTVAAWFACNTYSKKDNILIEEDCNEIGVYCYVNVAEYEPTNENGYLFIISKNKLKNHDIKIFDLAHMGFSEFTPRYVKQYGVMIGPTQEIPEDAIIDVYQVDYSCLYQFSIHHSINTLFPNRNDDIIYKILLSTPYEIIDVPDSEDKAMKLHFYRRALDIPEYDYKFTKINSSLVCFYRKDLIFKKTDDRIEYIFYAPSHYLFHTTIDTPDDVTCLLNYLNSGKIIVIECQGLLRQPQFHESAHYIKGAYITRIDNATIGIGGIDVLYKGTKLHNYSLMLYWQYSIKDNKLVRTLQNGDCPCNNYRIHYLFLTIIKKANVDFKLGNFENTSTHNILKIKQ